MEELLKKQYAELKLPEIEEYWEEDPDIIKHIVEYKRSIQFEHNKIYIRNTRANLVEYVSYNNSKKYNKDYISKLIYEEYVRTTPKSSTEDSEYSQMLCSVDHSNYYTYRASKAIMKDIVKYYDEHDKEFADYIRSINCILWIVRKYRDIYEEDKTFYNYNTEKLEKMLTPELRELLKEQDGNTPSQCLRMLGEALTEMPEYQDIFEEICHTGDWSYVELSNIIAYVDKYDLDIYTVMKRLSGDYYWSMYKLPRAQPGLQSTSIMVLGDLKYEFPYKLDRTPDVQKMIHEIENMGGNLYIKNFKVAVDHIIDYLKRTVEKHLTWKMKII